MKKSGTGSRRSGGGRSSSGGNVYVSGYTRANGTYVQGYVRSAAPRRTPNNSPSPSVSASGHGGTVQVGGYTRRDGTQVSGYTRSMPRSRNSSWSGSQGTDTESGQGQRTVQVSAYTRADGTRVSGHTRSMPGAATVNISSNSSGHTRAAAPGLQLSGTSTHNMHTYHSTSWNGGAESGAGRTSTVQTATANTPSYSAQVSGYTDGLLSMARRGVNRLRAAFPLTNFPSFSGYRNPAPASSGSSSEANNSDSDNESGRTDQVTTSDHTQASNGATVPVPGLSASIVESGHTGQVSPNTSSDHAQASHGAIAPGSSINSSGDDKSGHTDEVSAYTGAAQVADYTTSTPGPLSDSGRSSDSGLRYYVNNAYNRRLNRLGQPLESCVAHSSRTPEGMQQRCYIDNPHNRHLHRVGKPIPPRRVRQQELLEENTIQDLVEIMQCLALTDTIRPDYQYVVDKLQREEIEETWRAKHVIPLTETSRLTHHYPGMVIPFDELQLERRVIGRGGFGNVYAGMWHGTPVAFKKLHYQHMSRERRESFATEIAVLAAIDHDNTVKMFGAVLHRGNRGIVMEYLPRSLFQAIFVDCTEFSESRKKEMIGQVASAVQYLHTHKPIIAHCDIKSENVLLDRNNNTKLGDFGLSAMRSSAQSSTAGTAPGRGTPHYSAPEVLRGELLLTMDQLLPTDVYSLSIVVFEVLVEEEPFDGLSLQQLEAHVGHGDLRPTSSVRLSQPVAHLLESCWDAASLNRPTSTEFLVDWSDISVIYEC